MIQIKSNQLPELIERFHCDQYYDIIIFTKDNRLQLQLSLLSKESGFFQKIRDSNLGSINLGELAEGPLIRILKGLYGEELKITSMEDLSEIYPILVKLQIRSYVSQLQKQLLEKSELRNCIEFIQLSFKYNFLKQQLMDDLIKSNLKVLADVHNYFKLSKISLSTFEEIMIKVASQSQISDSVIKTIMENYFTRNKIKPALYFQKIGLGCLQTIWQKFHHVKTISPFKSSSSAMRSDSIGKSQSKGMGLDRKQKQIRIQQLFMKVKERDAEIEQLQREIQRVHESRRKMNIPKLQPFLSQSGDLDDLKRTESNPLKTQRSSKKIASSPLGKTKRTILESQEYYKSKSKGKNKRPQGYY